MVTSPLLRSASTALATGEPSRTNILTEAKCQRCSANSLGSHLFLTVNSIKERPTGARSTTQTHFSFCIHDHTPTAPNMRDLEMATMNLFVDLQVWQASTLWNWPCCNHFVSHHCSSMSLSLLWPSRLQGRSLPIPVTLRWIHASLNDRKFNFFHHVCVWLMWNWPLNLPWTSFCSACLFGWLLSSKFPESLVPLNHIQDLGSWTWTWMLPFLWSNGPIQMDVNQIDMIFKPQTQLRHGVNASNGGARFKKKSKRKDFSLRVKPGPSLNVKFDLEPK